jgi:arginine decarboxylase
MLPPAAKVEVPGPEHLRLELARLPRDAFFARTEQVPTGQATGRIAAEMLTPYPPGIPAAVPGELLNRPVLDFCAAASRRAWSFPTQLIPLSTAFAW